MNVMTSFENLRTLNYSTTSLSGIDLLESDSLYMC